MTRSLAYEPQNALNAICPYFTMFPLEYPLKVLKPHRKNQPIVMDPFCGRGTTLFAARKLGLLSRGIDSSPIAVAIAKAKLCKVDIDKTLAKATLYLEAYQPYTEVPENDFFKYAFTPKVLSQICAIRYGLLNTRQNSQATVLLRAAMLGCLHGPLAKNLENQSYFSNQMHRTFSSKPDYSVRFWKERELCPPETDVISVLRRKLSRIEKTILPDTSSLASTRLGDSRFLSSIPIPYRDFSMVITSPPYYGMNTYIEDQWLRNWFLGGPNYVSYGTTEQLQHTGPDAFIKSLGKVWRNMARTHAADLHMYVRFGTIPSARKVDPKRIIRASLEDSGFSWKIISIRKAETAESGKRQAKYMNIKSDAALEYDFHIYRQ